jgi:hypothetical protein
MVANKKNSYRLLDRTATGVLSWIDDNVGQTNVQLGAKVIEVWGALVRPEKVSLRPLRNSNDSPTFLTHEPRGHCAEKS